MSRPLRRAQSRSTVNALSESRPMPPFLILIVAVLFETIGTTALQASQQFSKLGPSIVVVLSYAISFFLLSVTLKFMPVGVVYALWSGMGIVFIAIIGLLVFGQKLDFAAVAGLGMIVGGIVVIHLFSNAASH